MLAAKHPRGCSTLPRGPKGEKRPADVIGARAKRLKAHGLRETEASIANKLSRGTFPATFFLAVVVAIGLEVIKVEDI
jgi:Domain of unknown function (DUF6471)